MDSTPRARARALVEDLKGVIWMLKCVESENDGKSSG